MSYHTFCLMSSGAKKHIRDNTVCQCTVAQIYLVIPECSARESCDNIGLFSLSPRLVHLPDRRYIRDCCPYWNPLVTLMTRGFAGVRACRFDNCPLIHLIPFCVAFDLGKKKRRRKKKGKIFNTDQSWKSFRQMKNDLTYAIRI